MESVQAVENIKADHDRASVRESQQYLTFKIHDEEFGISINAITEIKAWSEPTRLPNAPKYVVGVMNLRGVIIPVFSLKSRFGLHDNPPVEKSVVIFIRLGSRSAGIIVDSVQDIVNVIANDVRSVPKIEGEIKDEYLTGVFGIGDRMILLLDTIAIFEEDKEL